MSEKETYYCEFCKSYYYGYANFLSHACDYDSDEEIDDFKKLFEDDDKQLD